MLQLSPEQRMLVEETERLTENEFAESAFTREGEYPAATVRTLADHGFLGTTLPPEYGGGVMSEFDVALQVETIGRACPDAAASSGSRCSDSS